MNPNEPATRIVDYHATLTGCPAARNGLATVERLGMLRRLQVAKPLGMLAAACLASACTSDAYVHQARSVAEAAAKAGEILKSESQERDNVRAEKYYREAASNYVVPKIEGCIQLPGAPDVAETCRLEANGRPFEPADVEPAIRHLAVSWGEYFGAVVLLVDANNSEAFGESVTKLVESGFALAEAVKKADPSEESVATTKERASAAANIIATAGKAYDLTRKTSAIKEWSAKHHPLVVESGEILARAYTEGQKIKRLEGIDALTKARQRLERAGKAKEPVNVIRSLQDELRTEHASYMSKVRASRINPFEAAIAAHERLARGEGASFGEKDLLVLLPLIQELKQSVDAFNQAVEQQP